MAGCAAHCGWHRLNLNGIFHFTNLCKFSYNKKCSFIFSDFKKSVYGDENFLKQCMLSLDFILWGKNAKDNRKFLKFS